MSSQRRSCLDLRPKLDRYGSPHVGNAARRAGTLAAAASDPSLFAASPRDRSAALTRSAAWDRWCGCCGRRGPRGPGGWRRRRRSLPGPGGGVDQQLPGPQVHAVQVDSGRRTVAELEVDGGLLDLEGCLTGPGRVAGGACPDQGVQGRVIWPASSLGTPLPPACFQAAAMASTHEAAAAHRRARRRRSWPGRRRQGRQLGRRGPPRASLGTARATASRSPPKGGIGCATQLRAEYRGDPGLDQAKAHGARRSGC